MFDKFEYALIKESIQTEIARVEKIKASKLETARGKEVAANRIQHLQNLLKKIG